MGGTYKDYHVSLMHSNGTTAYETAFVTLSTPLYTFVTVLLLSLFIHTTKRRKWQFLLEFLILVLPLILNVTVLAEHIRDIFVALFVAVAALSSLIYIKPSKTKLSTSSFRTNFLTNARAIVSILSVTAILAVDFKIFPRRFAKTESFGYSLMDTGVGFYVFSNGIIAPEARGRKDSIKLSIKSSLPLFILGGARFIFVNQTDYSVPVSEYGVHWNFFITLGLTKVFSSFILNIVRVKYIYINAILIVMAHEILLQTGLKKLALIDIKRQGFIMANREGIISCLGYVSIYLFAVYFGYLLDLKNNRKNRTSNSLIFVIGSLLTLALTTILQYYFGISRRLANSAYCFWIVFMCIFLLGLFYLVQISQEFLLKDKLPNGIYSPLILEAVNYNGLVFFLTANLLTGLVNMSIHTLTLDDSVSLIILVIYMFINCFLATLLYYKQIKLKL